ncbi:MAG: FixH family protein [Sulfurimonas sp.]|nr:FixH family protein [Sulfurimonas sp.]
MKLISLIIGVTLLFTSLNGAAFDKEVKSRDAVVKLSAEKPLVVGNNTFVLHIKKSGVLSDADKVSVKVFMPAMPGMPAMESKSSAKYLGNGYYEVEVNFSMGGTWQIHIFVAPKVGKKYRVKSSVNI